MGSTRPVPLLSADDPSRLAVAIHLTPSSVELATAATDVLLGVVCVALAVRVLRCAGPPWRRLIWCGVLVALALGSWLGAAAHGLVVPSVVRTYFWQRIYLSLGLALALMVVAAIYDAQGERAARRALPWAAGAAFVFFTIRELVQGGFAVFLAAEAVAVLAALAVYGRLWRGRRFPGSPHVIAGLVLTLVASAVQVSRLQVVAFGWPLDHNSLFHLAQIAATLVLAEGVRRGMVSGGPDRPASAARPARA